MNPNSSWITKFLYNFGTYIAIAICLTFIVWSYVEPGFYVDRIDPMPNNPSWNQFWYFISDVLEFLFMKWTIYILPWVIIVVNILWQRQR